MAHIKKILFHLLAIAGISLLLGFVFLKIYLPSYTNHGESVSVPDLSGYDFEEAKNILENSDLTYEVSPDSGFSVEEKELAVLKQIPGPSQQVKNGRRIYLTLNARNAPLVKLPNLVNMPLKNVQEILTNLGLKRGEIIYVPDIGGNVVLKQQYKGELIQEGFEVPKGEKIDLIVGDGLGNQILGIPNLVGMEETDAEFLILGSGLRIGEITYEPNEDFPSGRVFMQSPSSKTEVKTGAKINLWIAKND